MVDHLFEALANTYRRRLLVKLLTCAPQEALPVPESLYEGETGMEKIHTEIAHKHLPKLEEAGFIKWDRDASVVMQGPQFEEIEPFVRLLHDHADELPNGWV